MPEDWQTYYFPLFRVLHIGAGILWIGLLYYFNFVQVPAFAKMEPAARSNAIMFLVPRALFFFRWAALVTVAAGVAYLVGLAVDIGNSGDVHSGYLYTPRFKSIATGGALGTIMLLNVWGIIWPNQKKIIAAVTATVKEGKPAPPEQPKWARWAFLASRTNTLLSIPMLFFMVAAIHFPIIWTG